MKTAITQLLAISGLLSGSPFTDQITGFIAELEAIRTEPWFTYHTGSNDQLDAFAVQMSAWDSQLAVLASPRRLVEAKAVFRAMAEFVEAPDGCADHMTLFDDLLDAGDVITVRISEALAGLAAAVAYGGAPGVEAAVQVIDQLTADLIERVQWIDDRINELADFEQRLSEVMAIATAASDPCLKAILERTVPPDVAAILNIN
ncbi:MAG: hypothetical protein AB2795_19185 [Candidatus Thiodiazotropha endolucinida]